MRFRFDMDKTLAAAGYLLSLAGGRISILKLVKMEERFCAPAGGCGSRHEVLVA